MSTNKLVCVVGSDSKIEIDAVYNAFLLKGRGTSTFEVRGIYVNSGVNAQPVVTSARSEHVDGAINRAKNARKLDPDATCWIGIESGILNHGTDNSFPIWTEEAAISIIDQSGNSLTVTSAGIPIPTDVVNTTREKGFDTNTIGSVMVAQLGYRNANDPHFSLLHGKITRQRILEDALVIILTLRFG